MNPQINTIDFNERPFLAICDPGMRPGLRALSRIRSSTLHVLQAA
jgi:hypothetical protein